MYPQSIFERIASGMKINDDISDLYNSREGTVNILGAGPSLFYVDARLLEKHDCIYVNSSALLIPKVFKTYKIWLSLDRLCIKWSYFWDNVMKSECIKLGKMEFAKDDKHIGRKGFRYFKTRNIPKITDLYDNCLAGSSSIPAAIDLALKMGYSQILLFGVDQRFIQGKSHFWEFYPKQKRPKFISGNNVALSEQKKGFEENKPYFEELKKTAERKGANIFNCSKRTSSLDTFTQISTKEGLSIV